MGTLGCKPFDLKAFLEEIENEPKFKEIYEDSGIELDNGTMSVPLTYYDFLTPEETKMLKESDAYKSFHQNKFPDFYVKLHGSLEGFLICDTPNMCKNCKESLQVLRQKMKEEKL